MLGECAGRLPLQHQRWASTLTSWSNARHQSNTRPLIERCERSYFFEKPKAKKHCSLCHDLCRSLTIMISWDRLLHFQWKKTLRPIPQLSKGLRGVVSINLPILPFLNLKFENFWIVLMPTSASGCWQCDLCLHVKLPRGRGGEGGRSFLC